MTQTGSKHHTQHESLLVHDMSHNENSRKHIIVLTVTVPYRNAPLCDGKDQIVTVGTLHMVKVLVNATHNIYSSTATFNRVFSFVPIS